MGKDVVMLQQPNIINSVGLLQLSAGQEGGCEAATTEIFSETNCHRVVLGDASNAFNSLNRTTALMNVEHTCPELATHLINTSSLTNKKGLSRKVKF